MIKFSIKIDSSKTTDLLKRQKRQLEMLPANALIEFKSLTPIDKGNARRKTTLKKDTIEANYPYAVRLDNGHSQQAPKGMTEPFLKWFEKQIKKIARK